MAAAFEPDYRHFEDVMRNRRPARLPLCEHIVGPEAMEAILGTPFAGLLKTGDARDRDEFVRLFSRFSRRTIPILTPSTPTRTRSGASRDGSPTTVIGSRC